MRFVGNHQFIFSEGTWLGEGKVHVSHSSEELKFLTRWNIEPVGQSGKICTLQEVQISGLSDMMHNNFIFSSITDEGFSIELENQNLGKITGDGIIRDGTISWELRSKELGFEGFEFYQLQDDQSYFMQAEYASKDDFRSSIRGHIWKQSGGKK